MYFCEGFAENLPSENHDFDSLILLNSQHHFDVEMMHKELIEAKRLLSA